MRAILKFFTYTILIIFIVCVAVAIAALFVNHHVKSQEKDNIVCAITSYETENLNQSEIEKLKSIEPDCIIVLGAGIRDSETPTSMLRDRLEAALELYNLGVAPKILLTGDNGRVGHNEIHVMLKYVQESGVPNEDIFCDHAGFSTYESMYRARDIFKVKNAVIVTQTYHMSRSLYIAHHLGLGAYGASSDQDTYHGQTFRELREILARDKDFLFCLLKPPATYGGDSIPITGDGVASHGE